MARPQSVLCSEVLLYTKIPTELRYRINEDLLIIQRQQCMHSVVTKGGDKHIINKAGTVKILREMKIRQ